MHSLRVFLLASVALALPFAADAQGQPAGDRRPQRRAAAGSAAAPGAITAIDVRGNQRIEPDTIRSYMLLQPGDRFDADRLDRSLKSLYATGLFRDVQMRQEGSRIVVQVQENPIVNQVAFEGNRKISDDNIRPEMQMRPRAVFTAAAVQADRQRILDLYARRGRYAAQVTPKIIRLDQNRVNVVYEITEGDIALIARVNFVGNHEYSDGRLRDVVATKEQAWFRLLGNSDEYDPQRLSFDRELLRRFYLRNGYADIEVTGATAELAPDRSGFFVTYTLSEGQRYDVGKVDVVSHLNHFDAATVRGDIGISSGDVYDGDAVERTAEQLTEIINRRGFPFVDVQPRISRNREKHTVDLTFEVTEAPRVYVERIDINGNTRTQDRVIRREFRVAEGDPFNAAAIRRSRERIRNLGFFQDVQVTTQPGSAPDRAILNTSVQERATGEISIGGGYSTDAGILGDVGLRERNLLGTGIDGRINTTIAQKRDQVDLSVTDPAFMDRNIAVGADVFYIERYLQDYSSYDERQAGFTLRAGYEFTEFLRQSWAYTLSNREVYDITSDASILIREQAGSTLLSQVSQTLTYDRRDNRLDPHRGYVVRLGTDLAGLGGDVGYARGRVDGTYYIPFERWLGDPDYVLTFSGSAGYIYSFSGSNTAVTLANGQVVTGGRERIVDRFFLGGENMRGFQIAGVGPRDTTTSDSLGGRLLLTQTTEFRFPLPLPSEVGLLGRVFADVGSLSGISEGDRRLARAAGDTIADDSSPRVSVGVGVSWRSPFGLINVDLGVPVVKKSYDKTQVFRFGFGTRF